LISRRKEAKRILKRTTWTTQICSVAVAVACVPSSPITEWLLEEVVALLKCVISPERDIEIRYRRAGKNNKDVVKTSGVEFEVLLGRWSFSLDRYSHESFTAHLSALQHHHRSHIEPNSAPEAAQTCIVIGGREGSADEGYETGAWRALLDTWNVQRGKENT
jgi:hypothetical protein